MNVLLFFILLGGVREREIDSLKVIFAKSPSMRTALEINALYREARQFDSANAFLQAFESNSRIEDKPYILYSIADNNLFAGQLNVARTEYMELVAQFANSGIANDALERLYLIETARKDTLLLKRLARHICLYETGQFGPAADSLKSLLDTGTAEYAYLYTALAYLAAKEHELALGALGELNRKYPAHKLHRADLLLARVYIELGSKQEARKVIETLIVREPNSVYLIEAKEMLKEIGGK